MNELKEVVNEFIIMNTDYATPTSESNFSPNMNEGIVVQYQDGESPDFNKKSRTPQLHQTSSHPNFNLQSTESKTPQRETREDRRKRKKQQTKTPMARKGGRSKPSFNATSFLESNHQFEFPIYEEEEYKNTTNKANLSFGEDEAYEDQRDEMRRNLTMKEEFDMPNEMVVGGQGVESIQDQLQDAPVITQPRDRSYSPFNRGSSEKEQGVPSTIAFKPTLDQKLKAQALGENLP